MHTEEAVPTAVVFEEVDDGDQGRKNHVNIAFQHTADADGSSSGVVFALRDGQDVNVVVEEGGCPAANDNFGQSGSGYTMITHDEVKAMREELEQAKQTVERQIIELDEAKEMILEQQIRITELEEDMKKHELGEGEEVEKSALKRETEEKKNVSSLQSRIEELEKTVERLKKVVGEKEEQLHQKELMTLQKDAEHDIVKTMNSSEVSTLKKLLGEEREKRVIAEMQVKMLLGSIQPADYLKSNRECDGKKTTKDLPFTSGPPPPPVSTSSQTENVTTVDDGDEDEDDDVLFIEEVEKECTGSGEVADADSGYPRCNSENEAEKVDDLMKQKFVCKSCGLVCTSNSNLTKHIRTTHEQPDFQLQTNTYVNSTETETVTPISGSSQAFISPHNLRRRKPSNTVPINDIRRSSSSSATSSAGGNWSGDKNTNSKGNGKFICTLCEERYPIVSKLKIHMKHSHGIEDDRFSIGCKDCGIIFYNRRDHIFHRRITHGTRYNGRRPNALTRPSSSGNNFTVTLPGRNDEEASALPPEAGSSTQTFKNHAVDVNRLRFGCFCTCGLEFRTTSHIKIHIKLCNRSDPMFRQIPIPSQNAVSHEDTGPGTGGDGFESNMVIDENGMRIMTIRPPTPPSLPHSIQQRHRIVGVDPKIHRAKYHCSCGKIYYNRASFQIHAKSKNMGRIFKCGWCTMSFDLHGNLKSHVRAYHKAIYGNGKFACGNCAQTFDNSGQLSRHRTQDCMKK